MNKKIIAALCALTICLSAAACGQTDSAEDAPAETTAAQSAPAPVTMATEAVPTEPVDLSKGLTDAMYERAVVSEGNKARLAKAMKKAANGEDITVGVIGGSITQGSSATDHNTDKLMNKYSYDSLVRKILNCDSQPAVMLLFTTQEDGTSLWETHKEIGAAYDLPMLSYRAVVYPEVSAGTLDWKDISPDNIHPNDEGHKLIGQLVSRYLDSVYDDLDNIDDSSVAFDTPAYTADYYKDAKMLGASDIAPQEISGFEQGGNSVYPELFPDNFVTEGEGYLKFETECKCLGFFYLKKVDGKGGKYDVYVDGERKGTLDADFKGGWGNYGETQQILISKDSEKHTVEIKLAEGSTNTSLTILGIMES